ncbi:hypothetical protein IFR05_010886 [Cadophora sp. M221]|nr:hypothetical protein IFR05_010886 [Cadophora sp. M221]
MDHAAKCRYYTAFRGDTSAFPRLHHGIFEDSWYYTSISAIICGVIWLAVIILGPIKKQQMILEPVRDAFYFRPDSGLTFQPRMMTPLIHSWLILVLQAYRPGLWSLIISLLFWDIDKVEDPPSEPSSEMTVDEVAAAATAEEFAATIIGTLIEEAESLTQEQSLETARLEKAEAETEQDEVEMAQERTSKGLEDKGKSEAEVKATAANELEDYQQNLSSEFKKEKNSTPIPAPNPEQPVELGIRWLVDGIDLEPKSDEESTEGGIPVHVGGQEGLESDHTDRRPELSRNSAQSTQEQVPAAQKTSGTPL